MAERAGVSHATVSMILNRRNNVSFSVETVERVEQAARELGYELETVDGDRIDGDELAHRGGLRSLTHCNKPEAKR